jgi:hypothetical protein
VVLYEGPWPDAAAGKASRAAPIRTAAASFLDCDWTRHMAELLVERFGRRVAMQLSNQCGMGQVLPAPVNV